MTDASIFLLRLFLFTKQYGQASSVVTLEASCFVGNIIAHHYEYGNAQSFCCEMYSIFLRITVFGYFRYKIKEGTIAPSFMIHAIWI